MEQNFKTYLNSLKLFESFLTIILTAFCTLMCLRVDGMWTNANMMLVNASTVLCVVSILLLSIRKIHIAWSLIDTIVFIYGLYLIFNILVFSKYPIASQVVRIGWCFASYWGLRVVSSNLQSLQKTIVYILVAIGLYESGVGICQVLEFHENDSMLSGTF